MPRNSKIKSHNFDSVTRANLFNKRRDLRKNIKNATKSEKLMNGIAIWCSFYRMFPHVFVKDYFGITLKPFQKILLYFMMVMNHYIYIASRGQGK